MLLDFVFRIAGAAVVSIGAYFLARILVSRAVLALLARRWPIWAASLRHSRLAMLTALLVSVAIFDMLVRPLGQMYPRLALSLQTVYTVAGIAILAYLLATLASVALTVYEQQPLAKEVPLRGLVQFVDSAILIMGFLMIVTTLMGVPAIHSFTVLAAAFTALGFVFQEPLLGFLAGIQLAANKMVAIGDWIDVPQYGASGTVQEILMTSVKVQNWDNTITTVPARAMISDSFKNWHSMYASGGRRLERSVYVDILSVRLLSPELAARYPTLAQTWQQIKIGGLSADAILAGEAAQHPTNLGLYRVYLTHYLKEHPRVNRQMLCMVRQLQIQQYGVPLDLYLFLLDTDWPQYETTAASIFEYVFATLPEFGLRPIQWPSCLFDSASATNAGQTGVPNAPAQQRSA